MQKIVTQVPNTYGLPLLISIWGKEMSICYRIIFGGFMLSWMSYQFD